MGKLNWKEWLGVGVVALVVAVVAFLGLLQVQHWRTDEETFHAVVQLLNYNVAQGRLAVVAGPTSPVAAAPAPAPTTEKPTGPAKVDPPKKP